MDTRSRTPRTATERREEPVDDDVTRSVSPNGGVTPTPDWLLTFLAHQEERDAKREERHEATMHMLCEAFSGRSRHTPPAEIAEDIPVDGESAPVTQCSFSGARAKARAPEQMPADITLRDLSAWRRSWDDFAELEQLERFPVSQQRAMLRTHLTVEMRAVLQLAIGIDTDDASSVSEILDAIHGYVRSKRNVTLDRVALEERRQQEGETFDEYYIALREIANNADLCKVCIDDRLTTRIMSGIRDPEIRRKLLAHTPPPSLQTTINICRSEESARNDELELVNIENDPTKVDKIRKHSQYQRGKPRLQNNTSSKGNQCCGYCGKMRHQSRDQCPARRSECSTCKKVGHWAACCRQKQRSDATNQTSEMNQIRVLDVIGNKQRRRAPRINVDIHHNADDSFITKAQATPDTGAEATVAGLDFLKQMKIEVGNICAPPDDTIVAANGTSIECIGTVDIHIHVANRSTRETVLICKGQQGILLAWYVCRDLGIIPKDYPKQVCAMKHTHSQLSPPKNVTEHTTPPKSSTAKHAPFNTMDTSDRRSHTRKELLEEFKDVFSTSDELKTMTGEPMKIHLKENVETFAISTTRSIPFAWRDEVKENLDRMTRQGIVKPLGDSPTRWCHPLVVVPKSKGGVRLCVDLTKLNTFVRRPIHPMKTPKEAVSNIKPESKYFSTLDATQGYWQIALSQESQELTTFLTPWGRYLFLRSPMGLSSTGDEYCRRGDIAIAGLSNVEKVMDDVIVFDDNFDQHVDRVRALLLRCREHGITLNPDKFKFAEKEVKFVGFIINAHGVSTDPDKLKAISEFPIPSCLTDLRSFMGLINQLGDFTTDVSTTADPLRELLKTKNEFRWTETHTTAFQATKKALVTAPTLAHYDPSKPTALHTDASRRKGLGYALLQKHADKWKLIQCGSRFLTETESRYAMVEL